MRSLRYEQFTFNTNVSIIDSVVVDSMFRQSGMQPRVHLEIGYGWRILSARRLCGSRLLWGYKRRGNKAAAIRAYSAIVVAQVNSPTVK